MGLNFELLELELFNRGLAQYKVADFMALGYNETEALVAIGLLSTMRDQEIAHVALLKDILGPKSANACVYDFPYTNLTSYISFN